MNNSITNALHAGALFFYTYLVYINLSIGAHYYNSKILQFFIATFILKILGIIVHLPAVENIRSRHNFFWTLIAIGIVGLNYTTLTALNAEPIPFWIGILLTIVFCSMYIRSLFIGNGDFYYVAIAFILVYAICALIAHGSLRIAWICVIGSNLLWIALQKVEYLREKKFHNDIYHFALIGSSYLLYKAIANGGWEKGTGL